MSKKLIGLLLFFLFAFSVFAEDYPYVVKTYSQISDLEVTKNIGSGLLFSFKGNKYVITSEHVVWNGTEGFHHSIANKALKQLKANLIRADWEMDEDLAADTEKEMGRDMEDDAKDPPLSTNNDSETSGPSSA